MHTLLFNKFSISNFRNVVIACKIRNLNILLLKFSNVVRQIQVHKWKRSFPYLYMTFIWNIFVTLNINIKWSKNHCETYKLIQFEFPTLFENEDDILRMFSFHVISKFWNCTILIAYVRTGLCLFKDLENQKGDFLILFITIKLSSNKTFPVLNKFWIC